ncbi:MULTISPECIES: TolC family protein [Methylobacterium]|jgi:outer membrane protein TolC|uniref:Transporter n=1 Tax=Methylobacterium aquaticum TaxID=270351 RepID=A0A0C6FUW4_9HYPH|nr:MULTISPECIES: TolC family protein [Methylobacterium]BAQ49334.1 transporter [Methylobacterium aquaticum]
MTRLSHRWRSRCLARIPAPGARSRALAGLAGIGLLLGGCASFSPDAGLSVANGYASLELRKDLVKVNDEAVALTAEARAEQLLRRPLTADSAVQIALLKNRGLQAAFNDLGVSEALFIQATLPPLPRVSLTRTGGNFALEIDRSLVISLFELSTLPARAAIAQTRFRADQYRAADQVLRLAGEARRQFYRTVSANQSVAYLEQALASSASASTLAKQLGETGALNKLEQAREHAFYSELGAQLAKARVFQRVEREKLIRLLGLWGREINFGLPNGLPPLPGRLVPAAQIEAEAMKKRADLQVARFELQSLAGQYGLNQVSAFINVFDLGYSDVYDRSKTFEPNGQGGFDVRRDTTFRKGYSADLIIPIYDFGTTVIRGAKEAYLGSAHRLAERAVNARSEVREAYQRYRGQYDITRHYQSSVLPLRKTIQDQALLQYSGMLIDVTTLIIDARARILSNIQAIEAQRDFWIAATDLKAAVVGGGFTGGGFGGESAGVEGVAGGGGPSLASATPGG